MDWQQIWPTRPGSYWFYGWTWMGKNDKLTSRAPKYHYVEVRAAASGGYIYICNGAFMYESERHVGLWAPVELPHNPPSREEIAEVFGM